MSEEIRPAVTQRNSRTVLFKIKKDKTLFPGEGSQAIFVMKHASTDPDADAVVVKRTAGYPGGLGGDDQALWVSLPPPSGGTPVKWGLKVYLKPTDTTVDLEPGEYYVQVDIIPVDPIDRFTAIKTTITIEATGIQAL